MNRALWKKAFSDLWMHLLISSLILVGFSWIFPWLISLFKADVTIALLRSLPGFVERMMGIPFSKMVTPVGGISLIFIHVITLLVCIGWAVGRGSNAISGEIGRGTMDLLVSLPIWRMTLIFIPAVANTVGAAALSASIMLGIWLALHTVQFPEPVRLGQFMPGAINLFAMIFCLTAITTLISSVFRDRWRTIALSVGVYLVSLIIEAVCKVWPAGAWLGYFTFLNAFQPHELILMPDGSFKMQATYDGTLLAIGLLCYAAGAAIFTLRDIPTR